MTTIKRFLTLFLIASISVCTWSADPVTIVSWTGDSRTANQTYAPTSSQTDYSGARLKSECGITTAGSGGCAGAYYGDWTNGNSIYITGLNLSGYSDISLDISLRRRNATCTASFYVSTNGSSYSSSALDTKTLTNTCTNYTVSSIGSNVQAIKITMTGGSGNLWLGDVSITGTAASTCTNTPTMSFTNTTVNKTTADNTYTQAVNISGKGSGQSVSYSSSDESIATVNNSGVVTLKSKVGTTTITASVEASGTYCSASASYTLNVTQAPINVTLNRSGATEVINNVSVGTALDDIDGDGAQGGCDAWTFIGWSKSQRAAQNNSTPMDLVTTVDNAGPYYAVYQNGDGAAVVFNPATDQSTGTSLEKGGITISTTTIY